MVGTQQVQEINDMQRVMTRQSCNVVVSRNAPTLDSPIVSTYY
jgi:hypothetical protein